MIERVTPLLTALMLLVLSASAASAQSQIGTVSLDCYSEPEGITVASNTLRTSVRVIGATSTYQPEGDPERVLNVTVPVGETVTIPIGNESPTASDNIFNDDLNETGLVYIELPGRTDGRTGAPDPVELDVSCTEPARFGGGLGSLSEPATSDNQQAGADDNQAGPRTSTGDKQQEPAMPDTGSGGLTLVGGGVPVSGPAALALLCAAAGCALLRRR